MSSTSPTTNTPDMSVFTDTTQNPITKDRIQRMVVNTLCEARHDGEALAVMSWHFARQGLSCFWKSDFETTNSATEMSKRFKLDWKQIKASFKEHGSRPCEAIDKNFGQSSMKWYGLIIPYEPESPFGELFTADPLTLLGFGYWIDARVIWFANKTNRDRYLKYLNSAKQFTTAEEVRQDFQKLLEEVTSDPRLSVEQKRLILQSWKKDMKYE